MSDTPLPPDPDEEPQAPSPEAPALSSGDPLGGGGSETPPPADDTPTAEQPPPPARRFLRSRDDRVFGGVAGGLASYFAIDPLLVRIGFVALTFLGGTGLIAYAAALLFVPEDDGTGQAREDRPRTATIVGAGILGAAVLLGLGDGLGWFFGPVVPTMLFVGVLAIIAYKLLDGRSGTPPTAARIAGATLLVVAALAAAVFAFVGAAWAAASGGGEAVAAVIVAIGVAMVALAFNRPARWLAVPAIVLAVPLGVVAAADIDAKGGVGERTHRPLAAAQIPAGGYELGAGELVVDLRRLDWSDARTVDLDVEVGVGHALVLVPEDVCVGATAEAGMGYIGVLGDDVGGVDVRYESTTIRPRSTRPRLNLDAEVGVGAIEVRHRRSSHDGPDWDSDHGWEGGGSISPAVAADGCAGEVR